MLDNDTEPLPLAPLLSVGPQVRRPAEPWPARITQGFSRWLPIVLMASLALFTFWLARQSSPAVMEKPQTAASHVPDYEMTGFSIQRYGAAGTVPSVIEGDRVRHYPDTDTFDIDGVRLRWVDLEGRVTRVTARRATLDPARNEVVLLDQGHLQRPRQPGVDEGLELWGDHLIFDTQLQTMRSDRRVLVRYGEHQFEGGGAWYDHRAGQLALNAGVKGRVQLRRR